MGPRFAGVGVGCWAGPHWWWVEGLGGRVLLQLLFVFCFFGSLIVGIGDRVADKSNWLARGKVGLLLELCWPRMWMGVPAHQAVALCCGRGGGGVNSCHCELGWQAGIGDRVVDRSNWL